MKLRSRNRESVVPQAAQLTVATPCSSWSESKVSRPQGLELAPRAPSHSSRLSVPFKGPCLPGGDRTHSLQWPSASGTPKTSHPIPQAPQTPPAPLAPHHLVLVRDPCPYQLRYFLGQEQTFPGLPASLMAMGPPLPPPTLWLPEGHLAEVQINGFNRQSSDLP